MFLSLLVNSKMLAHLRGCKKLSLTFYGCLACLINMLRLFFVSSVKFSRSKLKVHRTDLTSGPPEPSKPNNKYQIGCARLEVSVRFYPDIVSIERR